MGDLNKYPHEEKSSINDIKYNELEQHIINQINSHSLQDLEELLILLQHIRDINKFMTDEELYEVDIYYEEVNNIIHKKKMNCTSSQIKQNIDRIISPEKNS